METPFSPLQKSQNLPSSPSNVDKKAPLLSTYKVELVGEQMRWKQQNTNLTKDDIRAYCTMSDYLKNPSISEPKKHLMQIFLEDLATTYNFNPCTERIFLEWLLTTGDADLAYKIATALYNQCKSATEQQSEMHQKVFHLFSNIKDKQAAAIIKKLFQHDIFSKILEHKEAILILEALIESPLLVQQLLLKENLPLFNGILALGDAKQILNKLGENMFNIFISRMEGNPDTTTIWKPLQEEIAQIAQNLSASNQTPQKQLSKMDSLQIPPLFSAISSENFELVQSIIKEQPHSLNDTLYLEGVGYKFNPIQIASLTLANRETEAARKILYYLVSVCDDKQPLVIENETIKNVRKTQLNAYFRRCLNAPKPSQIPTTEEFKREIKEFKEIFCLKRVSDIFKPKTRLRKELVHAFFANPIISAYLLRKELPNIHSLNDPVYDSKYEKKIYQGMSEIGIRVPSRLMGFTVDAPILATQDQSGVVISEMIKELQKKQSIDPNYSNIIVYYDKNSPQTHLTMEKIGEKMESIIKNIPSNEGLTYVILPTSSVSSIAGAGHASVNVAIIDNQRKKVRAFLLVNSSDSPTYNQNQVLQLTMSLIAQKKSELVPEAFINCNHSLQLNSNDTNCAIYSLVFMQTLVETFADPTVRQMVESYKGTEGRSEIAAKLTPIQKLLNPTPSPEDLLSKTIQENMQKNLPNYYNRHYIRSGSDETSEEFFYTTKPWEGPGNLKEVQLTARWDLSRIHILNTVNAANEFATAYLSDSSKD